MELELTLIKNIAAWICLGVFITWLIINEIKGKK